VGAETIDEQLDNDVDAKQALTTRIAKRKEALTRLLFALGGAILAVIVGVAVNVVSYQINKPFAVTDSSPAQPDSCIRESGDSFAKMGHQAIEVYVAEKAKDDDHCWRRTLDTVIPGDVFQMEVKIANFTGKVVNDMVVQAYLPEGYELVPRTTRVANTTNPEGLLISDRVVSDGVSVGNYADGATAYVIFDVRMNAETLRPCDFTASAIAARLSFAPDPDSGWASAGVVSVGDC